MRQRMSNCVFCVKKRQRNIWSLCFCVFQKKQNTKTHWLSDAISVGETTKSPRLMHFLRIVSKRISYNTLSCFKKNTKRHKTQTVWKNCNEEKNTKTHLVIFCLITSHICNIYQEGKWEYERQCLGQGTRWRSNQHLWIRGSGCSDSELWDLVIS